MKNARAAALAAAISTPAGSPVPPPAPVPILDNGFFLEEAENREAGVVLRRRKNAFFACLSVELPVF